MLTQRLLAFACAAPVPSPFAIGASFSPQAFSSPDHARVRLTLAWDVKVEAQVEELVALALSPSRAATLADLRVVSTQLCKTSGRVNVVLDGARRSCKAFVELAAMRNVAAQTAQWSAPVPAPASSS